MDFGEAKFIISKYFNKQLLVIDSLQTPGMAYKFHKSTAKLFACASCKKLGKSRTVTVVEGRIVGNKNPEDDHHEACRPVPRESIDVLEIDRNMRSEVRRSGKRPREAYAAAVATIPKRFKTSAEQTAVVSLFPAFSEIRGSLYRHRSWQNIPVPDPCDIPEELRSTVRGKSVEPEDENFNERFLLYSGQDGKLLIFGADTELTTLFHSEYIIADGTFEMAPDSSYQLYTVHGILHGEGSPLLWALLPNKTKATYVEMFSVIQQAFRERFSHLQSPSQRVFITDFELAAIAAIEEVFPNDVTKGCTFHFRQALHRNISIIGLSREYALEDTLVKDWVRMIMGLTLLPAVFVPTAWDVLKTPPYSADPDVVTKMQLFSQYFQKTWMEGSFPVTLWNHFDNTGPRTTNIAEGWHNGLNTTFGTPHPSAGTFLNWLQGAQYLVQARGIQLNAGRQPKQRSPTYRELDQRISHAKLQFGLRSGWIFVNLFPHHQIQLEAEILSYLKHAGYLIAGNALNAQS